MQHFKNPTFTVAMPGDVTASRTFDITAVSVGSAMLFV